jgi:hypothetical protein
MVYLHEIALPEYKSLTGSLGYVSLGIGVVLGILVVAAVLYTVTGGEAHSRAGLLLCRGPGCYCARGGGGHGRCGARHLGGGCRALTWEVSGWAVVMLVGRGECVGLVVSSFWCFLQCWTPSLEVSEEGRHWGVHVGKGGGSSCPWPLGCCWASWWWPPCLEQTGEKQVYVCAGGVGAGRGGVAERAQAQCPWGWSS